MKHAETGQRSPHSRGIATRHHTHAYEGRGKQAHIHATVECVPHEIAATKRCSRTSLGKGAGKRYARTSETHTHAVSEAGRGNGRRVQDKGRTAMGMCLRTQ